MDISFIWNRSKKQAIKKIRENLKYSEIELDIINLYDNITVRNPLASFNTNDEDVNYENDVETRRDLDGDLSVENEFETIEEELHNYLPSEEISKHDAYINFGPLGELQHKANAVNSILNRKTKFKSSNERNIRVYNRSQVLNIM